MTTAGLDALVFGQRLRHLRRARGLTLDALGGKVGKGAPYLSLVENGRREVRLSLIDALAGALEVTPADLLAGDPPSRRAHLEIALERAQEDPLYRELRLPWLRPSSRVPDDLVEHVLCLFDALKRRSAAQAATPEATRRANADLRAEMRDSANYFAEIERAAAGALAAVGYDGRGAVAERMLSDLVAHFGFSLHRVQDLPISTWSVTDLVRRRVYLHQRNTLPTRDARSVVLQTLGHFALGHGEPTDVTLLLRQRVEANYFAGAVLAPERPAVELLAGAQRQGDVSAEDLKQVFYISYEMAAHRLTNLATRHLDLPIHFLRSDEAGVISKAYENDGVPLPADGDGAIEGNRLCRRWGARQAFRSHDKFADHAQYTETTTGLFWCTTHLEVDRQPNEAITIGVRGEHARSFRGNQTANRSVSRCPDGPCCRRGPTDVAARWHAQAPTSEAGQSYVLAPLPTGTLAGVDLSDVDDFLERHVPEPGS